MPYFLLSWHGNPSHFKARQACHAAEAPKVYVLPVGRILEAQQVPKCVDVAINIIHHSFLSEVRALARLIW